MPAQLYQVAVFALLLAFTNNIVFTLEQGGTRCFYNDLDSEKILELSFQIRRDQPQCLLMLSVQQQPELHDLHDQYPVERFRSSFQCQDSSVLFEPYVQKFSVSQEQGMARLKVCVGAARAEHMTWLQLKFKEKMNPIFLVQDEELSLVTSKDLRILHETVHSLTNKLIGLQTLQEYFKRTEEELMTTNNMLKEDLKTVNRVQVAVIVIIGVLWVVILGKAK